MMSLELWLAFLAASLVVVLIPGPTVTLVVSYALSQGRGAALAMAIGVALGDLVAMSLSLAGLGALLAASATLFTAVKVAGALYLVWLDLKLWRAPVAQSGGTSANVTPPVVTTSRMFGHAFAVTALNPKSIVFFVAFVPHFIDRSAPYTPQVVVLVLTFATLGLLNALCYALLASHAGHFLRRPHILRIVNRVGGGVLMSAGAAALVTRTG
jgi:threonine/homoserine/homoserine lactone efflux protein